MDGVRRFSVSEQRRPHLWRGLEDSSGDISGHVPAKVDLVLHAGRTTGAEKAHVGVCMTRLFWRPTVTARITVDAVSPDWFYWAAPLKDGGPVGGPVEGRGHQTPETRLSGHSNT